jgi:hypothetical protein
MLERGCGLRLLNEAASTTLVGQGIDGQHLDGDVTAEP